MKVYVIVMLYGGVFDDLAIFRSEAKAIAVYYKLVRGLCPEWEDLSREELDEEYDEYIAHNDGPEYILTAGEVE